PCGGEVRRRRVRAVAAADDRNPHRCISRFTMRIQYTASAAGHSGAAGETHLNDPLVHPRERTLGSITLVLGLIAWLVLVVGTVGIALVYLLLGFLFYLFAHSALISWLRGNGVLLSAQQLPDLRDRFDACCATLGLDRDKPEAYLLQGGGVL